MPRHESDRLPDALPDPRRTLLLDAARRCFIRNGFHSTSMRDVTTEAKVPYVGVDRYFPTMDDVITAFAEDSAKEIGRIFTTAFGRMPEPADTFPHTEQGFPLLAVRVWSAALRATVLNEQADEKYAEFSAALLWYVELYQRTGFITRDASSISVVRTLVALIHGFMVQRTLFGDVDSRTFREGLRQLQ
ncbi:helix-turn-helix domain-containing protein [Actinocorallia longicatena]|uniref:HTH tetR-type domain-containing protein n=1 Tax=Actinocorallia longicatena TaxID=111803 RepID=A0ABP6QD39_9ACTN